MFEIVELYLLQAFKMVPGMIIICIVFDFLGSFFFAKR